MYRVFYGNDYVTNVYALELLMCISTSSIDCLERLILETTYYVWT